MEWNDLKVFIRILFISYKSIWFVYKKISPNIGYSKCQENQLWAKLFPTDFTRLMLLSNINMLEKMLLQASLKKVMSKPKYQFQRMVSNLKKESNILSENVSTLKMDGYMQKILQKQSFKKTKTYQMKPITH